MALPQLGGIDARGVGQTSEGGQHARLPQLVDGDPPQEGQERRGAGLEPSVPRPSRVGHIGKEGLDRGFTLPLETDGSRQPGGRLKRNKTRTQAKQALVLARSPLGEKERKRERRVATVNLQCHQRLDFFPPGRAPLGDSEQFALKPER